MKAKPILFNAHMVRATMRAQNPKTQTRRPLTIQPCCEVTDHDFIPNFCPYKVGQELWVRETWANIARASFEPVWFYRADGEHSAGKWKPSIHMPRAASRLNLRIDKIRVQRVQDITAEDCMAEGIQKIPGNYWECDVLNDRGEPECLLHDTPQTAFAHLWNNIYGPQSWQQNPYVWAITFTKLESLEV